MTTIVMQSNASGTGSITFSAPNTSSNRVLNIPDSAGAVVIDSATQTLTNKTLTTPLIDGAQFATVQGTAPIYPCRAWVNFNGTGTVAIRASGNVSSITDNGVGDYTVNFTTAMVDVNFCVCASAKKDNTTTPTTSNYNIVCPNTYATTSVRLMMSDGAGSVLDMTNANVAIFR